MQCIRILLFRTNNKFWLWSRDMAGVQKKYLDWTKKTNLFLVIYDCPWLHLPEKPTGKSIKKYGMDFNFFRVKTCTTQNPKRPKLPGRHFRILPYSYRGLAGNPWNIHGGLASDLYYMIFPHLWSFSNFDTWFFDNF